MNNQGNRKFFSKVSTKNEINLTKIKKIIPESEWKRMKNELKILLGN